MNSIFRKIFLNLLFVTFSTWFSATSFGLIDNNGDGISDVWAAQHTLLNPETQQPATINTSHAIEALNPDGDYDNDGQTNMEESVFGTDPTKYNPVFSVGMPPATYVPVFDSTSSSTDFIVKVWGFKGKKIQLRHSIDLIDYTNTLPFVVGDDAIITFNVSKTIINGASRIFFKVDVSDIESEDSDLLNRAEEALLGTNPLLADTDGDKINDDIEFMVGLSPTLNEDSDLDGMPDDWEHYYFSTLDRDGTGDYDNDGSIDKAEFPVGTDPTNFAKTVVTASTVGEGTVSGSGIYPATTTVILKAIPRKGYEFTGWSGDVSGLTGLHDETLSFSADVDRALIATFVKDEIVVSANARGPGHIEGAQTYQYGDAVQLLAVPEPNASFVRWVTDAQIGLTEAELISPQLSFTATDSIRFNAHFSHLSFTDGSGAVSVDAGLIADPGEAGLGKSIAIAQDVFIAGAPNSYNDAGYIDIVRMQNDGSLVLEFEISGANPGDMLGHSVDTDGARVIVGIPGDDTLGANAGAVQIYEFDGSSWTMMGGKFTLPTGIAGDEFGHLVKIDGDWVLVSAPGYNGQRGAGMVFNWDGENWTLDKVLEGVSSVGGNDLSPGDRLGSSGDLSDLQVALGSFSKNTGITGAGTSYVFRRSGGIWSQLGSRIESPNAQVDGHFSKSLSLDRGRLAVGASGEQTAYVFTWNGNTWEQLGNPLSPSVACVDCDYGFSVVLTDNDLAVGMPFDGDGAYEMYQWNGASFSFHDKVVPNSFQGADDFGYALDLHSGMLVIGAPKNGGGRVFLHEYTIPYISIIEPFDEAFIKYGNDIGLSFIADRARGYSNLILTVQIRGIGDSNWFTLNGSVVADPNNARRYTFGTNNPSVDLPIGMHEVRVQAKTSTLFGRTAYSEPISVTVYQADDYIVQKDSDSDALDDYLELIYFGDLSTSDGSQDTDQDGTSDSNEILAGTDPNDSSNAKPFVTSVWPRVAGTVKLPVSPASQLHLTANLKNVSSVGDIQVFDRFGEDITALVDITPNGLDFEVSIDPDEDKFITGENHFYTIKLDDGQGGTRNYDIYFRVDTTLPVVTPSIEGGRYFKNSLAIELTASEDSQVLYSVDGSEPSVIYSGPIDVLANTVLKYRAIDLAGNIGPLGQSVYLLDEWMAPPSQFEASLLPGDSTACRMTWIHESGSATGYRIYRAENEVDLLRLKESHEGDYPPPAYLMADEFSGLATSHTEYGLVGGPPIYFAVTSVLNDGSESLLSAIKAIYFDGVQVASVNTEDAISKANRWLKSKQTHSGAWQGNLGNDIAATCSALLGLSYVDGDAAIDNVQLRRGLNYLHGRFIPDNATLAMAIDVLQRFGFDAYGQHVKLINNGYYASDSGQSKLLGWGSHARYYPEPYSTALALKARHYATYAIPPLGDDAREFLSGSTVTVGGINIPGSMIASSSADRYAWVVKSPEDIFVSSAVYQALAKHRYSTTNKLHQWILDGQNGDGSFGEGVLHTTMVLKTYPLASTARTNAENFLVNQQELNGSWHNDAYLTGLCLEAITRPKIAYVWSGTTNTNDTAIQTFLQDRAYTLSLVDDSDSVPATINDYDLVFISSSVNENLLGIQYSTIPIPVIVCDAGLYDEMGMVADASSAGIASGKTNIRITPEGSSHVLGANFSSGVSVSVQSSGQVNWGQPNSEAISIAELTSDPTKKTVFAYHTGDFLPGGYVSPGKRIGCFLMDQGSNLTDEGKDLLDAAVEWAVTERRLP